MEQRQNATSYIQPYTVQKTRIWNISRALFALCVAILAWIFFWNYPFLVMIAWIICTLAALIAVIYAIFPKKFVVLPDRVSYRGLFLREERLVKDITAVQVIGKTEYSRTGPSTHYWLHFEVQLPGKPLDIQVEEFPKGDQRTLLNLIPDLIAQRCPHAFVDTHSIVDYLGTLPYKSK